MAGGVGWKEKIIVPIYLSLCLLLLPSLLAYLFSFIFIAPTFFFLPCAHVISLLLRTTGIHWASVNPVCHSRLKRLLFSGDIFLYHFLFQRIITERDFC